MGDSETTILRQPAEQKERWQRVASEEFDTSLSAFIRDMTEAGLKKFDARGSGDADSEELRRLRSENADLRDELADARARIDRLRDELERGERARVRAFVRENPSADFGEVLQASIDTAPERVNRHLDSIDEWSDA